jgi:FkbM family methyltransferase
MFLNFEEFYKKTLPSKITLLEVGANKGQWLSQIITLYPNAEIFSFEPIPGITPSYPNVKLENCAVDIEDDMIKTLFITRDNVTSSLLELDNSITNTFIDFVDEKGLLHKKSDFDIVDKIIVKTKRLDTIIKQKNISEIHYIKIDTEGNDLNVFKSLGKYKNIVWGFEIEVWNESNTLFKGSIPRDESIEIIQSNGFILVDKFVHGKGLSSDLLFVNNNIVK